MAGIRTARGPTKLGRTPGRRKRAVARVTLRPGTGKVTINAITDEQMAELIQVVEEQVAFHKKLIAEDDLDADPEDLEMWQARLAELKSTSTESL